ncbi:MAG: hypothetical protein DMG80_10715 [Acidobacteria bacterium]|nr:MAG: hypothetical protein DMG80_10715 [Acidobacteriota bacterium]
MTLSDAARLSTSLLPTLAAAAVRALILGGVAGLGLAAFRVKATSVRLFTWTAVLYAAFAMPVLQRVLPDLPVPTPAILQIHASDPAVTEVRGARPIPVASIERSQSISASRPLPASTGFTLSAIRWNVIAAAIYLLIASLLLARFFVGLALGLRLQRAAQIIREPRVAARIASCTRGLSRVPQAAESKFTSVPVTMGVMRPVILLPATWCDWDDAKLDSVIAHEISHVERRDTLTQRLSVLHCTIFWFSPFAWWLNRHLAGLMEQASDEAALSCGVERKLYALTLLSFFEALHRTRRRVWWEGISMASAGRSARCAEERVERILVWKGDVAMSIRKSIAILVVTLAVPVVYLTASAQPAGRQADSQSVNMVEAAQTSSTNPPAQATHTTRTTKKSSTHNSYAYGYDDNLRFVIVSGKNDSLTMSGMHEDWKRLDELKKKIQGDFIWFRRDGKPYIIRDQATIDRAKSFWAPQEELGKKQEALGQQQEALGKQQEELGAKMEQVHVTVPDMTKDLEKLQALVKQLNSSATVEQLGELQSQIGELQSKLGTVQSRAGDQQSKLGEEMGALGEKQGKLGEQQGELGRQQGELAERANQQMKQLLDEAITKGTAQPESSQGTL